MSSRIALTLILLLIVADAVAEPATLRDRLPQGTVAYLRIPEPWTLLTAQKGDFLDRALADPAHQAAAREIRTALSNELLSPLGELLGPAVTLLDELRAPLEVAAFLRPGSPMPSLWLSTTVDPHSTEAINALLAGVARLQQPIPPDGGFGRAYLMGRQLRALGDLQLHLDQKSGRLDILASAGASQRQFAELLAPSSASLDSKPLGLIQAEEMIDQSGQGLLLWINTGALTPLAALFTPPELMEPAQAWGLFDMRSIALGWGVSGGKGRLGVAIDAPPSGYRALLPPAQNRFDLSLRGEPRFLVGASLPAAALLEGLERYLAQQGEPEPQAELAETKAEFLEFTGMTLDAALASVGPEWLLVGDEAGELLAVRLANPEQFHTLLQVLVERFGLDYSLLERGEARIHHLAFTFPSEEESYKPLNHVLQKVANRSRGHIFWIEEEGYALIGVLPQQLLERINHSDPVSLDRWLAEQQGLDLTHSALFATTRLSQTPRTLYHSYLQSLLFFADIADVELDLMALPTASELGLAESGAFALQLDASPTGYSFGLTFEASPFDLLYSPDGAVGGIAVMGILAAIAIPAYHDYVARAQVATALGEANQLKRFVQEAYRSSGTMPSSLEELGIAPIGDGRWEITLHEGLIIVRFGYGAAHSLHGTLLTLTPYASEQGQLKWECGYARPTPEWQPLTTESLTSSVAPKYLPLNCQP